MGSHRLARSPFFWNAFSSHFGARTEVRVLPFRMHALALGRRDQRGAGYLSLRCNAEQSEAATAATISPSLSTTRSIFEEGLKLLLEKCLPVRQRLINPLIPRVRCKTTRNCAELLHGRSANASIYGQHLFDKSLTDSKVRSLRERNL